MPIEVGTQITVVDGKLETVHCESRKSNPAPVLQWFLGELLHQKNIKKTDFTKKKIFAFSGERELRASAQKNVTEEGDDRRWKAYSVLEYVFSQDDFGNISYLAI